MIWERRFWVLLKRWGACPAAVTWARRNRFTSRQCWNNCRHADWAFWFLGEVNGRGGWPSRREIVLLACRCVSRQLHHIESDFHRARAEKLLQRLQRWARGEIHDHAIGMPVEYAFHKHSQKARAVVGAINTIRGIVTDVQNFRGTCSAYGHYLTEVYGSGGAACKRARGQLSRLGRNL